MFPTLRQQLPSCFLAQRLQMIELLIEPLGSTTHAGLGQFFQPGGAVVRGIDLLAGTGNGPTAIQPFEAIHHPGEIFGDGQITAGQFLQRAYARFSVVHRGEKSAAQQLRELAGIHSVILVSRFEQNVFPRIAHHHLRHMW